MKVVGLFLAFWLGGSILATAQPPRPRVVDLEGRGVAGVEIMAVATCFQTVGGQATATTSTMTDANGEFDWPQSLPGQGSGCGMTVHYAYGLKKDGYFFTRSSFSYTPGSSFLPGMQIPHYDDRLNLIQATNQPIWVNVSAASFALNSQYLATEMIVAGFGSNLATTTEIASLPLSTELAGRKVLVRDVNGVERAAQLLFVSPGQINYLMPSGLAEGPASIRLVDTAGNLVRVWLTQIRLGVPGIFTANATGEGVPAAVAVRVRPSETPAYEPVARFDETLRRFVPLQLDLGPESEFLVLALFGTGWHNLTASDVRVVAANARGIAIQCPIEYIGKQPTIAGLDQINVRLPRELKGAGEVGLYVSQLNDDRVVIGTSNTVVLNFK